MPSVYDRDPQVSEHVFDPELITRGMGTIVPELETGFTQTKVKESMDCQTQTNRKDHAEPEKN